MGDRAGGTAAAAALAPNKAIVFSQYVHDRDRGVALEEGELRDRQAARLHARHAARRESARVSRGPERDGDSDEPQIRRRGPEPADGEPGLRARAVVESRGGDAGSDARAPDRADAA